MPVKKKKLRNKIIFWLIAAGAAALMIYVPKPPRTNGAPMEYELY
jgi:hypothetical protein